MSKFTKSFNQGQVAVWRFMYGLLQLALVASLIIGVVYLIYLGVGLLLDWLNIRFGSGIISHSVVIDVIIVLVTMVYTLMPQHGFRQSKQPTLTRTMAGNDFSPSALGKYGDPDE